MLCVLAYANDVFCISMAIVSVFCVLTIVVSVFCALTAVVSVFCLLTTLIGVFSIWWLWWCTLSSDILSLWLLYFMDYFLWRLMESYYVINKKMFILLVYCP